ncbi:hypothetical protein BDU57DRAFT_533863 [Ampelomyces quisqualis]|uniref:Uncharacterized protein n=1 Tax=Ampelomyces quisqualis TaxID=50730 RepID=A0A6A5R1R3_AMPQU|nr:hypothetical protein BDU57DRAFT_533863 [Ampelomyces quisqualis]
MATPATFSNPARETQDLQNEKHKKAYQQGHDVESIPANSFPKDVEEGAQSKAHSTHTDEQTLSVHALTEDAEDARDPNIVDWDGPSDPANPQNWPASKK